MRYLVAGGAPEWRPITFMASAIIEPTSETVAGRTRVLLALASWPNWVMYCSATRSCTASNPPGASMDSATLRIPSAVAPAIARMASACPSASLICCCFLASEALMTCCLAPSA